MSTDSTMTASEPHAARCYHGGSSHGGRLLTTSLLHRLQHHRHHNQDPDIVDSFGRTLGELAYKRRVVPAVRSALICVAFCGHQSWPEGGRGFGVWLTKQR